MQLIIRNAKIYNGQAFLPDHYHILIEKGIIRLISRSSLSPTQTDAIIIDAHFNTVMPGLVEGHNHFVAHALRRAWIDLSDVDDAETGFEMLEEYARTIPENEWIRGGGWSLSRWGAEKVHKKYLDRLFPDRPVALESMDYHSIWINSRAQQILDIDPENSSVAEQEYGRDDEGKFNGILFENARMKIYEKLPPPSEEFLKKALKRNVDYYHRHGFTHAITMDGEQEISWIKNWIPELPMTFSWFFPYSMVLSDRCPSIRKEYRFPNFEPVGPKIFMDGAFGSLTAWLSSPYTGTDSCGIPVISEDEVRHIIRVAHDNSFGVAIHAIGDQAVKSAVNLFIESFQKKKFAVE
ncbi:MAG: hypothetical protein D6732_13700, partial [Methanobacteriota archaeon]